MEDGLTSNLATDPEGDQSEFERLLRKAVNNRARCRRRPTALLMIRPVPTNNAGQA